MSTNEVTFLAHSAGRFAQKTHSASAGRRSASICCRILRQCLPFVVVVLVFIQAPAQVSNRGLSGAVTDNSGSPIANARVYVKDLANGQVASATSDRTGSFAVPNLGSGKYEITASAQGFADLRTIVTNDANQPIKLVLQAVNSGSRKTPGRGEVNSKSISDLPLNGRSASDVAALEPGVATARTQTTGQAQRGFGTQMTISGSRPRQNDSRLDGISVNDYANGPPGSALGVNLGVDAVEQFSVLSSNYPAQYGRSSGGIVSASTRSGSNALHGDAYEFIRNSAVDARNYFNQEGKKPPFRRNQFGASLGGPIVKDRTFIFGDYEGLRSSQGITQRDTVPSVAGRAGNSGCESVSVDPAALRFINAFYPLPNGPILSCGETGIYVFSAQQVTPENYFTTKVDHNLSAADVVSGTYMFDKGSVRQPDGLNDTRTGYDSRRQALALNEAHTFSPTVLNSFRFGVNRVVARTGLTFPSGNPFAGDPTFGAVPGQNAPGVNVSGLTAFTGGLGSPSHYDFHWTSIQAYDDVSVKHGNHSLKFGIGIERLRDNIFAVSDPGGVFSFNSLSDFLQNVPFSLSAALPATLSERGFRETIFESYLQEDWRLRPNLTVNLGMRYEMSTVPTEVQNRLTVLRRLTDATPHLGNPLFSNPTLRNFEPRAGFTWDPFGRGKTAISAGLGIFDVLPLPYFIQTNELFSAPFFELASGTNLASGSFPNGAFSQIAASPSTFRQAYFEPNPKRNYVVQWNFTIQQQLTSGLSALIGYIGSRGIHQPFRVEDADIVMPTLTSRGYLWPSASTSQRLNLNTGRLTAGFWRGDSYYDALEIQVKKNFGRSSHLNGSYTWGKSIDTSSGSMVGDEYSNSISSPLWFVPRLNRGLSDFNIAQNLEINYSWEFAAPSLNLGAASWALRGWQLGGVFEASTGVPFTPLISGDALGLKSTDPNIDLPNVVAGPGCASLVNPGNSAHYIKTQCFSVPNPITLRGNLGRNTLIGPGLMNFDFSLFKNNYIKSISDRFNAQFRAEFFNLLNHPNFAPPLDHKNVFDSSGHALGDAGLITSTQIPSREIQFALKLIW